ncbi:carboxypeptidase-like regulatory domain-containing protein [Dehalobacterium formicoaceticum]|uniref:carboxypeptidase-like regulatory domain-containing protein n=1 Tax=Dehalobacterium formicoaceticum TaxID=51515 RepID=UPI000B7E020B|nr:carboxypeptidase-like regulatory domain-containing protein [Dehalobacterium formicoaceticum]
MQKSKLALVLTIVAILCLAFGGSALAAAGYLDVTISDNNGAYDDFGYTGCEASYVLDATGIEYFTTDCLNNDKGFDIILNFECDEESYSVELDGDYSLPVKVWAQDKPYGTAGAQGAWYTAQPTVPGGPGFAAQSTITLKVEDLQIDSKYKYITEVVVGDENQDLRVINPCEADEYCIEMIIDGTCEDLVLKDYFEIKSAPAAEGLVHLAITPAETPPGDCVRCYTVTGRLLNCADEPVLNWPLSAYLNGTDVTPPSGAVTDANGNFSFNIRGEWEPGEYTVKVEADGPCEDASATVPLTIEKTFATNMEIYVESADGVEDELRYNKCNDVQFCLFDDCDWDATVTAPTTIYFTATQERPGQDPIVAGHFYEVCPEIVDCGCEYDSIINGQCTHWDRNYGQINSMVINPDDSCVNVQMVPLVEGEITITATIKIGNREITQSKTVTSFAPGEVMMDLHPLATDDQGNVRAGWPIVAAVALDRTAGANYNVSFTINGKPVLVADQLVNGYTGPDYIPPMNYDEFVAAFGVAASECEGDYEAIFPYCTDKWYFMLYPCEDLRGDFEVEVTVDSVGTASADFFTNNKGVDIPLNFVTPVELTRELAPDSWQTFSTPKLLAARCEETPQYGKVYELLWPLAEEMLDGGPFMYDELELFVLGYENGAWRVVMPDEEVQPLAGYYVRTPQREKGDWNMRKVPFQIEYVFARATTPTLSMPYTMTYPPLPADAANLAPFYWNSVGVGVDDTKASDDPMTMQSDTAAQALGALIKNKDSIMVWNPGEKLANVNDQFTSLALGGNATPNTSVDPWATVYNGDVYWVFSSGILGPNINTTNVGLDMIEWIGGNYKPIAQPPYWPAPLN